jgi:hypothetical protein
MKKIAEKSFESLPECQKVRTSLTDVKGTVESMQYMHLAQKAE